MLQNYSKSHVLGGEWRGGWKDVIKSLYDNHIITDDEKDYFFFDIIESEFIFPKARRNKNKLVIHKKWIGIIHITETIPDLEPYRSFSFSLDKLLNNESFIKNLKNCIALIVFSSNVKDKVDTYNFNIPVYYIKHPINQQNLLKFDFENFKKNSSKTIVSLGQQLRKFTSIYMLKTKYKKIILPGTNKWIKYMKNRVKSEAKYFNYDIKIDSIDMVYFEKYSDYDNMLINNIIFIDFFDTAANNAILECIVRNIPVFVNKVGGIINYLGKDYPMYFDKLSELENILNNEESLYKLYSKTTIYLQNMDKTDITLDHFSNSIKNIINIYQNDKLSN